MSKEGEGLIAQEQHMPCRIKDCNGNLIFQGIKDRWGYFKCSNPDCETEFKHSYGKWVRIGRKNTSVNANQVYNDV